MVEVFYLWIIFGGLLFGVSVLLFKRDLLNNFLGFFFLVLGLHATLRYFVWFSPLKFNFPWIIGAGNVFNLLFGPLLYLYIRVLIYKKLKQNEYLHLIPAALYLSLFISYQLIIRPERFTDFLNTDLYKVVVFARVFSSFGYLILCIRLFIKYTTTNKRSFERWVTIWFATSIMFVGFDAIINTYFIVSFIGTYKMANEDSMILEYLGNSLHLFIVTMMHLYAMRHPAVFELLKLKIMQKRSILDRLEEDEVDGILSAFKGVLQDKKLYLRHDLTESELASELSVQPYILSKIINDKMEMNFNRYINHLRVEEAKRIMKEPTNHDLTIYAIARECGFNSESVFYANFKTQNGMTPTQYRRQLKYKQEG